MASLLIDLFYLAAAPFVLLWLAIPSRLFTRRRYRAGWKQKLGGVEARPAGRRCLWVHAVSVGEVRTAMPLLRGLADALPDWELVLSTATDTGFETAGKLLPAAAPGARAIYAPLDFSWSVRRSLRAIRPDALVLIELELWPNFLLVARSMGIPALVANGRLTERSARRYRLAGPLGRFLFSLPAAVAVQNDAYAARFRELGVAADRLAILGNLKYDVAPAAAAAPGETLALLEWAGGAPVVMGASTHPGEEEVLLGAAAALLPEHPDLRLILAPRHIERAAEVLEAARRSGIGPAARWSALAAGSSAAGGRSPRILIVDVIGELDRFYPLAGVVFVGGSLIPRGGQNLLEPARHARAVLFGPSMHNFADAAGRLLERRAAIQVSDPAAFRREAGRLLSDREARERLGRSALAAAGELGGAVKKHIFWVRERLGI